MSLPRSQNDYQHLSLEDFKLSEIESKELNQFNSSIFNYVLLKHIVKDESLSVSNLRKFF